ncbi:TIGR03557 family F420-dependent LLM class oxidoreductase [Nocardioides sp.]|uniref:TIGR03557 family F420-dependent LLM class oxidoreductase n=1 Tax=Nocardioides sp. TaxID=35761 RepID=UPI0027370911|nr:TIGR03557 family F420-dependent LLM class oxidoreductase [Nocardioides sp.]MDP3893477.1 TIGR03557 family F420-dependent LLM class oxidoreductase [Nocardioides sp.]
MIDVGIHAAQEQFTPSELLSVIELAEDLGFAAVSSSDHLAPLTGAGGQAGFAWSWLGAAMARTRLPFSVVTAPGQRYHPVVTAQAIATLAEMFPGRFVPALGSGQLVNERMTGERWPAKRVRRQRLRESAEMIRELLAGRTVTHDGLVRASAARLFTVPDVPPPLFAAAMTPSSACDAATWADGLVTMGCSPRRVREVVSAYRDAGGRGPAHLQVHVALAPSLEEGRQLALRHWRAHALPPSLVEDLPTPEAFDRATRMTTVEEVAGSVLVSDEPAALAADLHRLAEEGVDRVLVHHVGPDQERFLQRLGPALRG